LLRDPFGPQHSGDNTDVSPGATLRVASVRQDPNLVAPGVNLNTMRFIAALLCTMLLWQSDPVYAADKASGQAVAVIPASWLIKKTSVAEAEADHPGMRDERAQQHPELARPFGALNAKWEALKADMQPNDELWTFSSPPRTWEDLAGRAGIALVRDGIAIEIIVTMLN
jgi:hypothetical protein